VHVLVLLYEMALCYSKAVDCTTSYQNAWFKMCLWDRMRLFWRSVARERGIEKPQQAL